MYQLIRKGLLLLIVTSLFACSNEESTQSVADTITLDVYKSETCGCCGAWIEHMEKNQAKVTVHHPKDLSAIKSRYGIGNLYESCHTAVSQQGYVFEGHVPAKYVRRFLQDPPKDAIGLAVPGMPLGSPGMEMENRFQPYDIVLMKKDGTTSSYARIAKMEDQY